jgi:hypothetical protein
MTDEVMSEESVCTNLVPNNYVVGSSKENYTCDCAFNKVNVKKIVCKYSVINND